MYFYFNARGALFQTGWFIESLATQVLVIFVIRTSRVPFFKSRPGKWIVLTSVLVVLLGAILPYTPLAASLGFVSLPLPYFVFLIVLVVAYIVLTEFGKKLFLKKHTF